VALHAISADMRGGRIMAVRLRARTDRVNLGVNESPQLWAEMSGHTELSALPVRIGMR
jgi:hypothetical protein